MPYANEHACRLHDPRAFAPGSYRSMARQHGSKPYRVILGKRKGRSRPDDPLVEQTYRYPANAWAADEAQAHCRAHGGKLFESARAHNSGP